MKLLIASAILGSLLVIAGTGCARPSSAASSLPDSQVRSSVQTARIDKQPLTDVLEVPAMVEPDPERVLHVFAPVEGRVVRVEVRRGDRVHRGQTLAVLQSSDVTTARADYEKAKAEQERAQSAYNRASLLYEHQVLSQREYFDARAAAATAQSELDRSREQLQLLVNPAEGFADLKVTAARSGVVLDVGASTGEYSKSLDAPQPLCTVADLSSVWVLGDVYEKDIAALRAGLPVEVIANAYQGRSWSGKIDWISDVVDANTRTVKVRVVLPNVDHALKPDMFTTIRVLRGERESLLVPPAAVLSNGDASSVVVAKANGGYELRGVSLGIQFNGKREITSGLNPGEAVVTEGAALVRSQLLGEQQ
jgi:cobalt-zinc-cadmium efflux system membrane fusion protein